MTLTELIDALENLKGFDKDPKVMFCGSSSNYISIAEKVSSSEWDGEVIVLIEGE